MCWMGGRLQRVFWKCSPTYILHTFFWNPWMFFSCVNWLERSQYSVLDIGYCDIDLSSDVGWHYIKIQFDKYRYKIILQPGRTFSLKSVCVEGEVDFKGCFKNVPRLIFCILFSWNPWMFFSEYLPYKQNSVAICSRLCHFWPCN